MPRRASSRGSWVSLVSASPTTLLRAAALLALVPAFAQGATITVTSLTDAGAGSLRQAIADAAPGDAIDFAVAGTIVLTTGPLVIFQSVTIDGPGAASLTISAGNASRVFEIGEPAAATIAGVTIADGKSVASQGGGAIVVAGTGASLTLTDSVVENSRSGWSGGGIWLEAGTLVVTGSTVRGNRADVQGGGIAASGTVTITDSTISGNDAVVGGGLSVGGTVTISGSTVSGNASDKHGGGILTGGAGTTTLVDTVVSDNTSGLTGGGVEDLSGTLVITGSAIVRNRIDRRDGTAAGAGFRLFNTMLLIENSTIADNHAFNKTGFAIGGGMRSDGGGLGDTITIRSSTFSGNSATGSGRNQGGALLFSGTATIENTTFNANSAGGGGVNDQGGAIYASGSLTLVNATLADNTAPEGNAIYAIGTVTFRNTIVSGAALPHCAGPGTFVAAAYNLESGNSCGFGATDLVNTDPLLGPLADHGGPTATHALLAGSPALDAGHPAAPGSGGNACAASDQRGVARPKFAACDIGAVEEACGDGVLDVAEACDDGNAAAGDGCAACTVEACYTCSGQPSVCTLLPDGSPCDDGDACTFADTCIGSGACVGDEPAASCRTALKTGFLIKDKDDPNKDKVQWKWLKGAPTSVAALGNPLTTDAYTLCVYDESGAVTAPGVIFRATAPSGGTCPGGAAGKPCWKGKGNPPGSKGYGYKDKAQTPEGVDKIVLKPADDGTAKALVKGKGAHLSDRLLGLPPPPLNLPLRVQLVATNGECWEATYTAAEVTKNESGQFKAKGN